MGSVLRTWPKICESESRLEVNWSWIVFFLETCVGCSCLPIPELEIKPKLSCVEVTDKREQIFFNQDVYFTRFTTIHCAV